MSGRTYLSIGDVLSLLREEFPDVTISKIRFLESQGLVDPERSPSGYRKFYDHDVERLRWVLRQQRDQFLPLKVIRDRLAEAGNGVPSDDAYETVGAAATARTHEHGTRRGLGDAGRIAGTGGVGAARGSFGVEAGDQSPSHAVPNGSAERGPGRALREAPPQGTPPEETNIVQLSPGRAGTHEHPGTSWRRAGLGPHPASDETRRGHEEDETAGSEQTSEHDADSADESLIESEPHKSRRAAGPATPVAATTDSPATSAATSTTRAAAAGDAAGAGDDDRGLVSTLPPGSLTDAPSGRAASGLRAAEPQLTDSAVTARHAPTPRAFLTEAGEPEGTALEGEDTEHTLADPVESRPAQAQPGRPSGRRGDSRAAARGATSTGAALGATPSAPPVLAGSVSGVSLTLDELCAATGLSTPQVASLEGFGLIRPLNVAGGVYYDEEALTVAKLVVEFGRFGIEPRHLRLYRNAVDREVGLVEQVITPLLRQRNPEARQRAVDCANELVRLGQGLRAALARADLRRQLGG